MDGIVPKASRKEWRKLVKKLQRQRRRQTLAKARDQQLAAEEATRLRDPAHQAWLQQQAALEEHQLLVAAQRHAEEEEAWLRRDLLAHRQFRREQQQRAAADAAQEVVRLQQHQEFEEREAAKRRQHEERERRKAAAIAEFEQTMQLMDKYLSSDDMQSPPASLRRIVETRPGQRPCEFFERTSCCRFGTPCVFNHRRPLLSNILVLRQFFVHSVLEQQQHHEYASAETALESSERDLRDDYDAFFADVVPELEKFGKILNFRTLRNVQKHLRGHVFVEYTEERSALKAFINLQGRYYATRRLNVEFSKLAAWRGAVCGLSLSRKCPKGNNCNYLHLFRNPDNKYNTLLEYTTPTPYSLRKGTSQPKTPVPTLSWDEGGASSTCERTRHWRWSESPEVELRTIASNVDQSTNNTKESFDHKNENPRHSERHSREKSHHKRQRSASPASDTHQHKRNERRGSDNSAQRHYKGTSERCEKYKKSSHSKERSNSSSSSERKSSKRKEDRSSKKLDKHKRSNEDRRRRRT